MSEVTYSKKNDEIECVRYEKSRKIYLPHTHSNHLTIGYIEEGQVCITIDGESCIYTQGEEFRIMPNVLHEVKPADENPYSMMVMCIKIDAVVDDCVIIVINQRNPVKTRAREVESISLTGIDSA